MKFRELILFFLKKVGLSFLVIIDFVIGVFCWALTIYPFNFPYLLRLPSEETNLIVAFICGLLFTCVVSVSVRTKWCFENDLFFSKGDRKLSSLVKRIVTSQELITDVIVFAIWALSILISTGTPEGTPWYAVALGTLTLLIGSTSVFAVLDCLLYIIARKKADKWLYRREEE